MCTGTVSFGAKLRWCVAGAMCPLLTDEYGAAAMMFVGSSGAGAWARRCGDSSNVAAGSWPDHRARCERRMRVSQAANRACARRVESNRKQQVRIKAVNNLPDTQR